MSEAIALPVPTTPTSPTSPNNATGAKRFEGEGLPFKAKLIGMEDLTVDRDEKVCLESMFKLKAVAKARGEHKQRIQLNLTMSAVKVTDDTTKTLIANHEIERISFVVLDPRDNRAFGYIYNTSDDRHQFWAIKTEKNAAITVLAMKDLFELAFDVFTNGQNPTSADATKPVVTATPAVVPEPEKPAEVVSPTPVVQELAQATPVAPAPAPVAPLLIGGWDDDSVAPAPIFNPPLQAPIFNPPPQPPIDDLFSLELEPLTIAPAPVPLPKAEDPWSDFINPIAPAITVTNPAPAFPPVNPPSIFAPTPAPVASPFSSVLAAPISSLPMSPTSPIAPPTVTNPLLDLDLFGPAPTGRVTRDQFFPQQAKPAIGQLQNDRQA